MAQEDSAETVLNHRLSALEQAVEKLIKHTGFKEQTPEEAEKAEKAETPTKTSSSSHPSHRR